MMSRVRVGQLPPVGCCWRAFRSELGRASQHHHRPSRIGRPGRHPLRPRHRAGMDALIDRATSVSLMQPDWEANMTIVDQANAGR